MGLFFERVSGMRVTKRTFPFSVALKEVLFYIHFYCAEYNTVKEAPSVSVALFSCWLSFYD